MEALRAHVRAGLRCVLLFCPTAGGKTVLAAAIIHSGRRNFNARFLFIVHRLELIDQTVAQLARWGVTEVGVIRADDRRTNAMMPVQVATIQTLGRRDLPPADIVFSDECHHDAAEGRKRVLAAYPDATYIGLSATPIRLDGKPLGDIYQVIETAATYSELIADGSIVAPVVYGSPAPVDLSGVHTQLGDYVIDELEVAMNQAKVVGDLVKEWQVHADGRRTVVFACTIKHSLTIVEKFCEAGIRAEHLDGTTPEDARKACLKRLDDGLTQVVSNVGILQEGWDQPSCKCIMLARPTKSLSLYMQQVGRVMRPWHPQGLSTNPSIVPLVLDHAGNVDRHGMPHEDRVWSLDEKPRRKKEVSEYHVCPSCYAYVRENPCELCGYMKPVEERKIRTDENVGLVERKPEDERRVFFVALVEKARSHGFKPGYAGAKFKEKYNQWPPWSWSNEAKQAFAEDRSWQYRQVKREEERKHWQEKNAESIEVEIDESEIPF
jgi:DNA repair protein RadD